MYQTFNIKPINEKPKEIKGKLEKPKRKTKSTKETKKIFF